MHLVWGGTPGFAVQLGCEKAEDWKWSSTYSCPAFIKITFNFSLWSRLPSWCWLEWIQLNFGCMGVLSRERAVRLIRRNLLLAVERSHMFSFNTHQYVQTSHEFPHCNMTRHWKKQATKTKKFSCVSFVNMKIGPGEEKSPLNITCCQKQFKHNAWHSSDKSCFSSVCLSIIMIFIA